MPDVLPDATDPHRAARLDAFPRHAPGLLAEVDIRWNAHAVPYVLARHDEDAAYALGLVHVHLRGAQLQILKRIAQGRVAEMLGPLAVGLDHALRLLDLPGAAARCVRTLPATTRTWVEAFARGLTDGQPPSAPRPPEFRWLGLQAEDWTPTDVLTLGRLAGADVNWSSQLGLLRARYHPQWRELWRRLRIAGGSLGSGLAMQFVRAGSNSVVIGPQRSASGAPLMANDPHLGQQLPNFWVLAGVRCPSYHMVGFMPAGLPFVGVGAGPHFAWGGTNMRAASSDLVDVSTLPADQFREETVTIRVRGLGTRRRRIRRTPYGPVLNDARVLRIPGPPVALRWQGAEPSDEIGAFLAAARATSVEDFRTAFASFGVCAQNILFASRDGHIGHVYAAHLPRRLDWPEPGPILDPAQADAAWARRWDAQTLPLTLDPPEAYRVSANDRPRFQDGPLGYFFSEGDRAARLAELAARENLGLDDLAALQNDTCVPGAGRLAAILAAQLREAGAPAPAVTALAGWNGDYAADAPEPVLFEVLLHGLARGLPALHRLHRAASLDDEWGRHTRLLLDDLAALPNAARRALLRRAAVRALAVQRRHPRWGDLHRLRIRHLLGLVPLIGRPLTVAEWGAGGSRKSPMKNAHGLVAGRHRVQYGAQARHLSDLADPDANHFVLLGGNDGWIGAPAYADQLPLWRQRRDLQMPLRAERIAELFPLRQVLRPAATATPHSEPATGTANVGPVAGGEPAT